MKKLFQQIICLMLAVLLSAGLVTAHPAPVKAAEKDEYTTLYGSWQSPTLEDSIAGVEKTHTFSPKTTGPLFIDIVFAQPTAFSFQLKSSSGTVLDYGTITETDQYWTPLSEDGQGYIYEISYKSSGVGTYNFNITTAIDTSYALIIDQGKPAASLSNAKMNITAGFTDTLTVHNADGTIKWKSSNKNIATVNNKGVVSAKKKGKCTITATTEDGQELKCQVKVVNNVYTETKATNADADPNDVTAYVYKASLDAKGNLVCKIRVINNFNRSVQKLGNMLISVKNGNGKTVYSYRINSKTVNVPSYKYKDYTITIPKSTVKKCDLVKAEISFTGSYSYYK